MGNRRRQGEPGILRQRGGALSWGGALPRPFPCLAERFWYCRLALNHKMLHYGDLEENVQGGATLESLQEKSRPGMGLGGGVAALWPWRRGGVCPGGPLEGRA